MATIGPLQFRLRTLIAATVWASIVAWGLATRSELAYSVVFLLTLVLLLTGVLAAIFQTGRARAFAVGYLLFALGHLLCLYLVAGSLHAGLIDLRSPSVGTAYWLYYLMFTGNPGDHFLAICSFAATTILGCIGGIIASLLYSPVSND